MPPFKNLPRLKQIRLDGNLLTKLDTLAFANNPQLQLISLQVRVFTSGYDCGILFDC